MIGREDWFDPASLYKEGFPEHLTSALKTFPEIGAKITSLISVTGSSRALEIGPGNMPLIRDVAKRVYLDIAEGFLSDLYDEVRVLGDVSDLPFRSDSFDIVVVADVLPHVPPEKREKAILEAARVAKKLLFFNQERGDPGVEDSFMQSDKIISILNAAGYDVTRVRYDSAMERDDGERVNIPLDIVIACRLPKKAQSPPSLPLSSCGPGLVARQVVYASGRPARSKKKRRF